MQQIKMEIIQMTSLEAK